MIIREADPEDAAGIARVHVDTWRSTYRGIVSDDTLDGLSYAERQAQWESALTTHAAHNHIYVAESNAEVVGFVAAGLEREERSGETGEIFAIYLLKEYQGRGWGKKLFLAAADRLRGEGYRSLLLWVLSDNPTRGFYSAMGGKPVQEKQIEIGRDALIEVAYQWESIPPAES